MLQFRQLIGVGFITILMAGCATDTPPPPPPPPAPVGPPVTLNPLISDSAAIYVDYVAQAKHIKTDFDNADDVQSRLSVGSQFEPQQLARGAVAYAAIVAMQDPAFRATIRGFANNDQSRMEMAHQLMSDYTYVAAIPGVATAAERAITALSDDGKTIYEVGSKVKQSAYDVQRQKWSKETVAARDVRMANAKQNSVTLRSVNSGQSARLLVAAVSGEGIGKDPDNTDEYVIQGNTVLLSQTSSSAANSAADAATPASGTGDTRVFSTPYTSTVYRALTIAALSILGEGGANRDAWLDSSLSASDGPACFGLSKLNLYQCLAVSKPHYEDIFCLGQHVLMDTGQCLAKMSSNALSFAPVRQISSQASNPNAVAYLQPKPTPKKASAKKSTKTTAKKKK
jgi:hypothetical protein